MRDSSLKMFVTVVVLYFATKVTAQEQSLSTVNQPTLPFLDVFTGASSQYKPIRKTYSDGHNYHVSCPRSDSLASFASVLGSAAKIMFSAAVIAFLKLIGVKLLLFPVTVMLLAKVGLKAVLLWLIISKIKKYLKKKKKKQSRVIADCPERLSCVLKRSLDSSFGGNFGTALTFSMMDDFDEDAIVPRALLSVLAGDKVAECMSLDCNSGIDIS